MKKDLAPLTLDEVATNAAIESLKWLETDPYGDLRANALRAGMISSRAVMEAILPALERRVENRVRAEILVKANRMRLLYFTLGVLTMSWAASQIIKREKRISFHIDDESGTDAK